jgi:hypothetical protein
MISPSLATADKGGQENCGELSGEENPRSAAKQIMTSICSVMALLCLTAPTVRAQSPLEISQSEIRMAILQSEAILNQLAPALERKMSENVPNQDLAECMGSFIPGRYADVAPDGGPCIKPFAPMTEAERWQPQSHPKKKLVDKSNLKVDISNPLLKNPKEALQSADLIFFPEHDLTFQELIQAPQYYQESISRYGDSPGFAFIMEVPELHISADVDVTVIFEQDEQKSKLVSSYENRSDIPAEYRDHAVELTKDGVSHWEVYEAVSKTPNRIELYINTSLNIKGFSMQGVSLYGFVRPYLDEAGEVQVEVQIIQTAIHHLAATKIAGTASFIAEPKDRSKDDWYVSLPISTSSSDNKDALTIFDEAMNALARLFREKALQVDWIADKVEPVANKITPVWCSLLTSTQNIDRESHREDCREKSHLDIDLSGLISSIKEPNIKDSLLSVLETELRNNLNNSVLSDALKTPLASVFSTSARTRSPGTTTKAETELSSLSVWGTNPFDEELLRNPARYRPYEVETAVDVELSTLGTGHICASDLERPFSGAPGTVYRPSFDDVPTDYSVNRLSDSEDSPMLSKAEIQRLVAQADAAPLYNQEGPAAQVAAPFKLFAEGIYHHAKQGQLCQTIPISVSTPTGTVVVNIQLTPGGAPRVLQGSYTPIRPMTLQQATLILDARAAFLESIGEYAAFAPLVVHRSPDYDQAQMQLAHAAPVTAIQVDLPYNINGNSTGSGPSVAVNGTGLVSVFLEPATNCTNDNVEFEIKAILFSQVAGNVTISSPFGSTSQPITPTNTLGLTATDRINRDLYNDYYRPTYELIRRPEYVCGLPSNDHIYSVQTRHHVDARINLGFKATLVDDLGLSLHLSNFTLHENYLLGDATFKSECSRGPSRRTPPNHNQQHCIDFSLETNEVLQGARDYQAESEFINSLIETNEILHTQWAVAIQQQYGFGALQEFQSWLQAHVIVGPFYPQELNDLFVHSFLTTRNQAASNAQWHRQYSPGQ